MILKLSRVDGDTLRDANPPNPSLGIAPGEFYHNGDLKTWGTRFRCPRCFTLVSLSEQPTSLNGLTLSSDFYCPTCGFRSVLNDGEHKQRDDWKPGPPADVVNRIAEAGLGEIERVRPDAPNLPDPANDHLPL